MIEYEPMHIYLVLVSYYGHLVIYILSFSAALVCHVEVSVAIIVSLAAPFSTINDQY